jgi:hypothetical protein
VIEDRDGEMDADANLWLRHRIDQGAMDMSMEQLQDCEREARRMAATQSEKDSRWACLRSKNIWLDGKVTSKDGDMFLHTRAGGDDLWWIYVVCNTLCAYEVVVTTHPVFAHSRLRTESCPKSKIASQPPRSQS